MKKKILAGLAAIAVLAGLGFVWMMYHFGLMPSWQDLMVDKQQAEQKFSNADQTMLALLAQADQEEGYQALFDGESLSGWHGHKDYWSVVDGAIVGDSGGFLTENTFLYRDDEYSDYVLKLQFLLVSESGDSGVQHRSTVVNKDSFSVVGYQSDIAYNSFAGCFNDEGSRWLVARAGDRMWIDEDGGRAVVGQLGDVYAVQKKQQWNDYTIVTKGNRLIHRVNGEVVLDVIDDYAHAPKKGVIALQLHAGPRMQVMFKNIRVLEL